MIDTKNEKIEISLRTLERIMLETHELEKKLFEAESERDDLYNALRNAYNRGFEYAVSQENVYSFVDPDDIATILGLDIKEEREYFKLRKEKVRNERLSKVSEDTINTICTEGSEE